MDLRGRLESSQPDFHLSTAGLVEYCARATIFTTLSHVNCQQYTPDDPSIGRALCGWEKHPIQTICQLFPLRHPLSPEPAAVAAKTPLHKTSTARSTYIISPVMGRVTPLVACLIQFGGVVH